MDDACPLMLPMSDENFEVVRGEYGPRIILRAGWSDIVEYSLKQLDFAELELNHAKGWYGADLAFLREFPRLKVFIIIDFRIQSVAPVHSLHELRHLEIVTYCQTPIQFGNFPALDIVSLEWRPGSCSLFECASLTKLILNNYSGPDVDHFARLVNLRDLSLLNAPAKNVDGLRNLGALRHLRLANLKQLTDIEGIRHLDNLETLEFDSCRRIRNIDAVRALTRLQHLHLNSVGPIESLTPLDNLHELRSVVFVESTNICDGDLSPLTRQPHLTKVSFKNRTHYSHRREEFGAAYFDGGVSSDIHGN